ncbi:MAG TPA: riboflavin biosynthesis protein RibF, partial [Actinomycetota bacterium]|nr:riboflavin biosynthesis protein RibF [Actinomycetota bacterium]
MQIRRGVSSLPIEDGPTVVTIGFFDGVHLGHRAVLGRTVEAARERSARAVAVTFDRHPREVLTPGHEPRLLTTVDRKAELIAATGVDVLLILPFTKEFSRWPAEEFVHRVLANGLHAAHVAVGGDFTFGHRAAGTLGTLHELGPGFGFTVQEVPPFLLDGRRVSSSSIREALAEGDLAWPERALGRRYAVEGTVVGGAGRGHALGFPTANLETSPRLLLPGTGIYAGRAGTGDGTYVAAVSVGTNPTF